MNNKYTFALLVLCILGITALGFFLSSGDTIALFQPKGTIALQERHLMIVAVLLVLIVILPVFFLTFFFAWRYRAENTKAKYTPNWQENKIEEFIWWAVPCAIIILLAAITWTTSHTLDPFKPLNSNVKPLTIQVVALNWKWLFIYPEQHIATINVLEFPEQTPISFQVTADAPMNSFWIPQLGGQIYAMTGMTTQLHLMADGAGTYNGVSSNFSGEGFAGMQFAAHSVSGDEFNQWVQSLQQSPQALDLNSYNELIKSSKNNPPTYYSLADTNLYTEIVMKFMAPMNMQSHSQQGSLESTTSQNMQGMTMPAMQ